MMTSFCGLTDPIVGVEVTKVIIRSRRLEQRTTVLDALVVAATEESSADVAQRKRRVSVFGNQKRSPALL